MKSIFGDMTIIHIGKKRSVTRQLFSVFVIPKLLKPLGKPYIMNN